MTSLRIAVGLLSAAAIAYEILLIRILSITQWHHFAAMVISLALLGYGAGGTLLTLSSGKLRKLPRSERAPAVFVVGSMLFGILSLTCHMLAQRIPFNPLEILWNPRQLGYLGLLYLVLSLPFLAAATAIGAALMTRAGEVPRIYRADLIGAGVGAAGVVGVMFVLPLSGCLKGVGALGWLAAGVAMGETRSLHRRQIAGLLVLSGLAVLLAWPPSSLALRLSEYKALSKVLLLPDATIEVERSSPLGLLTVVSSPTIPFRHAPGLSLDFTGTLPDQLAIFTDGDSITVVNRGGRGGGEEEYMDYLPSAAPFRLVREPSVLVLGAGGGSEVAAALAHRASRVDAVEYDPQLVRLMLDELAAFAGNLYRHPAVRLHVDEARSHLRKSARRHDLVQIALVESLAASTGGTQSVRESYLYTVEAFGEILKRLRPQGVLAVTRWLRLPPRDNLKLFATAIEALGRVGVSDPWRHLVQLRGWGTVTTLVKATPFRRDELDRIKDFCRRRSFDLTFYPGMSRAEANQHNRLEEPYLYDGAVALLSEPTSFFERYKFDVRPATDDRPFFFHFFKWRSLPELLDLRGRAGVPLVEWGYLMLLATALQACLAGALFIVLPLRLVLRQAAGAGSSRVFVYFAALGLAFLLLEIAFIQRFTLFLGHPIYAVAVVVAGFLVFAGLGSGYSQGFIGRGGTGKASLTVVIAMIVSLSLIYVVVLPMLFRQALGLADGLKIALTLTVVAPLAFLMGMPFPLGLVRVSQARSIWVPWAWGINGCASVVSAALAPVIAIHVGFTAVVLVAAACYVGAGWASRVGPISAGSRGASQE